MAAEVNPPVLFIRNMVCPRCVLTVEQILQESGIAYQSVEPGEAKLRETPSPKQLKLLETAFKKVGFELITSRLTKLMEDTKLHIRSWLDEKAEQNVNLSEYLKQRLPYDYSYLSDLFSSTEGISIEQYFIRLRIDKVKELLVYNELSMTEIAYETGFSSVHHLSAQFKRITGLTPSYFRKIAEEKRKTSR